MIEHDAGAGDPTTARTFPQLIRAAAATYGEEAAIVLRGEGPADMVSFAGLDHRTATLAKGLIARGIGKGARVGFVAGNGPFFAAALGAIARIGAVAVPISTMIRADELVRVLRQSDVAGVIVQRRFLGNDYVERFADALPELRTAEGPELRLVAAPYLRWIATTGSDKPPAFTDLDTLAIAGEKVDDALLAAIEAEVHPTDQMIEIYTSGSMALPKGVRHDHGAVMTRAHYLRTMLGPARGREVAAYLPMFWVGGLMMALLPNWSVGATTVCSERTLTNSQVAMGSVLAPDDLAQMAGNRPYWGLGMSETLGPYAYGDELRAPGYPVCAPMDHLADGFEVRVADADDRPVATGTVGEIQVRGPALTRGLHKVERTSGFTADGYYRTGDMGLFEAGRPGGERLHFVGRDGDVIKTAGSNVSPLEVEEELQRLDGVHSAYVVGVPDAERGQLVAAAIVARDGAVLDFAGIATTMRARLSSYKVPRAYVAITRDEVPLLHSNKVSRNLLRALVQDRLAARS